MKAKVLLVDDEVKVLNAYRRGLGNEFELILESDPLKALETLRSSRGIAVIVSDLKMPGLSGTALLREAKSVAPDTVRIMLTGFADLETAIQVVNEGSVFRFLTKPCESGDLAQGIRGGVHQYDLIQAEKVLLNRTLNGAVQAMAEILSMSDPQLFGLNRSQRLLARELAKAVGLQQTWALEVAATMADIGKVTVPPQILSKQESGEPLSPSESEILAKAPEQAAGILEHIPRMARVAELIRKCAGEFNASCPDTETGILRLARDYIRIRSKGIRHSEAWETLSVAGSYYGNEILRVLRTLESLPDLKHLTKGNQPREVRFQDLELGHQLLEDILTSDGVTILKKGSILNHLHLQKIRNFRQSFGLREPIRVVMAE